MNALFCCGANGHGMLYSLISAYVLYPAGCRTRVLTAPRPGPSQTSARVRTQATPNAQRPQWPFI